MVEEEAGSIGRGGYGLFPGRGLDQFGLCRWGGVVRSVGRSLRASRSGSRGMIVLAGVDGVGRAEGAGGRDSPFGL